MATFQKIVWFVPMKNFKGIANHWGNFGMLTIMRLNKEGYDILKQELTKQEGPFSRTNNVMLALDLLEKGEDLSSGMVTKNHLINIIKVLCTQLQWTEEKEEQNTNTEEALSQNNDKIEEDTTNTQNTGISKKSQEICKFYKSGKCQYGRTGKKLDKSGKMCAFSHPIICKKFENYGYTNMVARIKNVIICTWIYAKCLWKPNPAYMKKNASTTTQKNWKMCTKINQ